MAFTDTTLSTLATISAWEKEVNQLAGYTQKHGILGTVGTPVTLVTLSSITKAMLYAETGAQTLQTLAVAGTVSIAATKTTRVDAYAGSTLIDSFLLNEGQGTAVYGSAGVLTGVLSNGAAWVICNATRTWQDKIDLAHRIVANDILSFIYNRLYNYTDDEILDSITNVSTFADACDLKALELIFVDLANGGFNGLHQTKATEYSRKYSQEISKALQRAKFDILGDADGQRLVTQGQLGR